MTSPTLKHSSTAAVAAAQFDGLLDALWPLLNELHGLDRSRRFWGILLHRYLAKYLKSERAGGPWGVPPDPLTSDEPVLGTRYGDEDVRRSSKATRRWVRDPRNLLRRVTPQWLLRRPRQGARSVLLGFHRYDVVSRLVPPPAERFRARATSIPPGWDRSARLRLTDLASRVEPDSIRAAVTWLPSWYVEEFRACYEAMAPSDAMGKEFHASFLPTPAERMLVARHVEAGSRLTFYQHAAMYGEVPDHYMYIAESSLGDRFRTWGWHQSPGDEPFVALRLMKPRHEMLAADAQAGRILYVVVRQPLPGLMEATLSTQRSFVNALGARARELIVRPRVNKGGVGALQVPADVRSRIAGVDSGTTNLATLVSTVSLVVLDMIPSTVFMECITGDVPVVAIVSEGTIFTPLAAEFYEEFTRLGILHGSPEDAARFVARLNTRSWWNDVSSRACVRDYQHTFCNRDLSLVRRARKSRLERIE